MSFNIKWNWQKKEWPNFKYNSNHLKNLEADFLYKVGLMLGTFQHINQDDKNEFTVKILSDEALKTSEIEGEYLNQDSIQSSIRKNFGLNTKVYKISPAEYGISQIMIDLYKDYSTPLTHEVLSNWHKLIMNGRQDLENVGSYRISIEPMQVVSGYTHNPKIHFEAPPSSTIYNEMNQFIEWFNETAPGGKNPLPILTRAAIAHLHFVCIHPFEDGNGRIARAIAERSIAQGFNKPSLIGISRIIHKNRKIYYTALENNNKEIEITDWIIYFAETIIEAQEYSSKLIEFLIQKARFYDLYKNQLNNRQIRVIQRIFDEGLEGFKGGLSAENYISISKTSRATATRDLQQLFSLGVFRKTGELKSTRYWLDLQQFQ